MTERLREILGAAEMDVKEKNFHDWLILFQGHITPWSKMTPRKKKTAVSFTCISSVGEHFLILSSIPSS